MSSHDPHGRVVRLSTNRLHPRAVTDSLGPGRRVFLFRSFRLRRVMSQRHPGHLCHDIVDTDGGILTGRRGLPRGLVIPLRVQGQLPQQLTVIGDALRGPSGRYNQPRTVEPLRIEFDVLSSITIPLLVVWRAPSSDRAVIRRSSMKGSDGSSFAHIHGRTSNTRLNGVSATRRNRLKPAASKISRRRASPACAPSAGPPWSSEHGEHSSVDPA